MAKALPAFAIDQSRASSNAVNKKVTGISGLRYSIDMHYECGPRAWNSKERYLIDEALLFALITAQKCGSYDVAAHIIHDAIIEASRTISVDTKTAENFQSRPRYADRLDRKQRASEFLKEHWRHEREIGTLTQLLVRKHDPKLLVGLEAEFRGKRDELRKMLPNRTETLTRNLQALTGQELSPKRRQTMLGALSQLRLASQPDA